MIQTPTAGVALKAQHYADAMAASAAGLWFEVHAENYMVDGGPRLAMLETIRDAYPLALHGVGLSLASAERPDAEHLEGFARLVDRFDPFLVSEHLAWSRLGTRCLPDLLPFPRARGALESICRNIDIVQSRIGRRLLIENPSHYLAIDGSCPTAWRPRGTLTDGYAAYLGPYDTRSEACAERVKRRGAFVTHLRHGNEEAVQCLCVLDRASLPELTPGQAVDPLDGVYVRYLEDLLTSMHLLRLDHHFDGHIDPLMVRAIKHVQADAALPQDGVVGKLTWQSLIRQGCQELSD